MGSSCQLLGGRCLPAILPVTATCSGHLLAAAPTANYLSPVHAVAALTRGVLAAATRDIRVLLQHTQLPVSSGCIIKGVSMRNHTFLKWATGLELNRSQWGPLVPQPSAKRDQDWGRGGRSERSTGLQRVPSAASDGQ